MTDIIDRIDELVDEQLADYHQRSGYDYNVGQDHCPRCGRHWHGLPITRHIDQMYRMGWYDPEYIHADDDSPILCEGSDFIGPRRPSPWEEASLRSARVVGNVQLRIIVDSGTRFRSIAAAWERMVVAAFRPIPDPPFSDLREWFLSAPSYDIADGELAGFVSIGNYQRGRGPNITLHQFDEYRPEPEPPAPQIDWTPGPHNWGCELRLRPETQLADPVLSRAAWDRCSPLGELVNAHWDEFADDSPVLPKFAGFDFTGYDLDPAHGVFAEPHRRGRR